MRKLLCLHDDTVQALRRLGTQFDDLTPRGLWENPYHLVTMTADQRDALQRLHVPLEDVTPTALRDGGAIPATQIAAQPTPRVGGAMAAAAPPS